MQRHFLRTYSIFTAPLHPIARRNHSTTSYPVVLTIFDRIKRRLGFGKKEVENKSETPNPNIQQTEDNNWYGQQEGYSQTNSGYPPGYPHPQHDRSRRE